MSWATAKEAVRLAVAAALDLEDYTGADGVTNGIHKVEWTNKKKAVRYLLNDSAWVNLQFNQPVAQGRDEKRLEVTVGATPALTNVVPTYGGRRLFSVQVQIGSESQEDGEDAVAYLSGKLRTRLRRSEILGVMQAAQVALRTVGPSLSADYKNRDGHWVSNSITELFLATVESDTDPLDTSEGWINEMESEGTYDGGAFPIQEDVDVVADIDQDVII